METLDGATIDRLESLGLALAIGLLIGLERGWKDRDLPEGARPAGVRTFTLIALLGCATGMLAAAAGGPLLLALAFIGFALAFAAFELLHSMRDGTNDATSVVAALLTFMLGAACAEGFSKEAGVVAVVAAMVLAFKENIHGWVEKITFAELRAGLILAAMSVVVLPLLPAEPIDPYGAVSPRKIWLLTVMVATISFAGYAAIRILGNRHGPLAAGVAGGLVSSTATVLGLSRLSRSAPARLDPLMAGAVAANAVMFVRVGAIAGALRPAIVEPLLWTLGPAALATSGYAAFLSRRARKLESADDGDALHLTNPLELKTALGFSLLLSALSLAAAAVEEWLGGAGTLTLAAVAGTVDVDAITLSATQTETLGPQIAVTAILVAVGVNTLSKSFIGRAAGGAPSGRILFIASALGLGAGAAGLALHNALPSLAS